MGSLHWKIKLFLYKMKGALIWRLRVALLCGLTEKIFSKLNYISVLEYVR